MVMDPIRQYSVLISLALLGVHCLGAAAAALSVKPLLRQRQGIAAADYTTKGTIAYI